MSAPRWTAQDLPDLHGRVAVVTGANTGLGLATASALVAHGATVVMACRDDAKAAAAAKSVEGRGEAVAMRLDLGSLASIRAFAIAFGSRFEQCDILCNNAGVMALPFATTDDGFELQFGVNHLGHFALTGLLLPHLRRVSDARVVTVTSYLHRRGTIDWDAAAQGYDRWRAYAQSKLANLMFALELQRRSDAAGLSLRSVAAHPGYAATDLQTRWTGGRAWLGGLTKLAADVAAQSPQMGALPSLYAAAADGVQGGDLIGPGGWMQLRGYPTRVAPHAKALDQAVASRLWQRSEELTAVCYAL